MCREISKILVGETAKAAKVSKRSDGWRAIAIVTRCRCGRTVEFVFRPDFTNGQFYIHRPTSGRTFTPRPVWEWPPIVQRHLLQPADDAELESRLFDIRMIQAGASFSGIFQ